MWTNLPKHNLAFRPENVHILIPFLVKLLIIGVTPLILRVFLKEQPLRYRLIEKLNVNLKIFAITMLFGMSIYAGRYISVVWCYSLLAVWLAQWIFLLQLYYSLFNLANALYKSMICLWSSSLILSGLFTLLEVDN